jgi:hypothetical protein
MITPSQHDELTLFLGCEELLRKTALVDMSALDMHSVLDRCYLYCVDDCANVYIQNILKDDILPNFDRTNVCFHLINENEEEESSKVASIVSDRKPEYVEELPFKPLPHKKKKERHRKSKNRTETVIFPKYVAPIIVYDGSNLDDEPMPFTYIKDHDWEEHATFDIENLYGTDSENSNAINFCTTSAISVPSNDDYGGESSSDSYFVEFAPTRKDVYVGSNNAFMHVAHDKHVSCDSYIVNFVHVATEGYHERGKQSLMHVNNI